MCGIAGIANKNKIAVKETDLEPAIRAIRHRGPDGQGYFCLQNMGIANCRLAIIDLKKRSDQPLRYKNYYITFNGAIYNYPELKKELQSLGHSFQTASDTEVVLAAYDEWGKECVLKFNGMWAFAIYDPYRNRLFCSRDRFGIKPFYYFENETLFCFASEIKAVLKLRQENAVIDAEAAYRFLTFGEQDYSNRSFFKDIVKLTPGHSLIYNLSSNTLLLERYYSVSAGIRYEESEEAAAEFFRKLFFDSVALRFRADVPIGSCLSGGLDSSSILASIHQLQLADDRFHSITSFYPGKHFDERKYADEISRKTGYKNIQISPQLDKVLSDLDSLIYTQDEPIPSAGIWLQNQVFQRAENEGLRVMLDGQGGDEILAGYDIFHYNFLKNNLRSNPLKGMLESLMFFTGFQGRFIHTLHSFKRYKSKQKQQNRDWFKLDIPQYRLRQNKEKSLSDLSKRLLTGMGIQALLHYEDRNSMAHSIETRLPFLDYRLVELCLSLPDHFKINRGYRKALLRKAFRGILPEKIRSRKQKLGFEIPYIDWVKNNREKFESVYSSCLRNVPFVNANKLPVRPDLGFKWRLIALKKWMEIFDVAEP